MNKQANRAETMISHLKMLVMDVDGTLTDGKIYMGDNGEIMKSFSAKDGFAIHEQLPKAGIVPAIITGRQSTIVENRARELGIELLYQGVKDKRALLDRITMDHSVRLSEIAYIGDDDNDLEAMRSVLIVGCPSDASENVRRIAHFISTKKGGEGAVREFIEWIIANGSSTS